MTEYRTQIGLLQPFQRLRWSHEASGDGQRSSQGRQFWLRSKWRFCCTGNCRVHYLGTCNLELRRFNRRMIQIGQLPNDQACKVFWMRWPTLHAADLQVQPGKDILWRRHEIHFERHRLASRNSGLTYDRYSQLISRRRIRRYSQPRPKIS